MNYGGTPVVAPSLREVPLESNHQALTFAKDLIEQRFGMVVLMTGVGVRLLIKVVEPVLRPRDVRTARWLGLGSSRAVPSRWPRFVSSG